MRHVHAHENRLRSGWRLDNLTCPRKRTLEEERQARKGQRMRETKEEAERSTGHVLAANRWSFMFARAVT